MIFQVLQLLVLGVIAVIGWKVLNTLKDLIPLLKKLDKPSVRERLASMTTVEAQKEMIRINYWIDTLSDRLAKKFRKEIVEAFNKKR